MNICYMVMCTTTTGNQGIRGAAQFIDGGVGTNNPTKMLPTLLMESPFNLQDSEQLIVVSLGTGGQLYKPLKAPNLRQTLKMLIDTSTECAEAHDQMERLYDKRSSVSYHRFDPAGVGETSMDDATLMNQMDLMVTNYLRKREVSRKIQTLAEQLMETPQAQVLAQPTDVDLT
jgi:hypothetical protein